MNERLVPGLPGYLQLVAPDGWRRFELEISDTPPSMNSPSSGFKGNHHEGARMKKRWQSNFEGMLMAEAVPRDNLRAIAGAYMRFPRLGRRDSGNYSMLAEKALGDALVNGRWIPDDDADRFFFAGVEFVASRGSAQTTVVLFVQSEEETHGS